MTTSTMPYGWGRVPFDYESRLPWRNLPFPEEEYEQRIARLRLLMAAEEMDGVIVVGTGEDSANIRYLANFQDFYGGETVLAVPAEGAVVMVTNAVMHSTSRCVGGTITILIMESAGGTRICAECLGLCDAIVREELLTGAENADSA